MSFNAIGIKISTRFKDLVEKVVAIPAQYDNAPFIPPENSRWMTCDVIHHDHEQVTLGEPGSRVFRYWGLLSSRLFAPIETGDGDLLAIADVIATAFKGVTVDGITYRTVTIPGPGSRTPDGKWWQVTVVCPWYSDLSSQ